MVGGEIKLKKKYNKRQKRKQNIWKNGMSSHGKKGQRKIEWDIKIKKLFKI